MKRYPIISAIFGPLIIILLSGCIASHYERVAVEQKIEIERTRREAKFQCLIREMIRLESSGRHDGCWGDNHTSYGEWQFQRATFVRYCRYYGLKNMSWLRRADQMKLATMMIRDGFGCEWSVYKKAYKAVYGTLPPPRGIKLIEA